MVVVNESISIIVQGVGALPSVRIVCDISTEVWLVFC
jgi:hypothetical protein